jgi:MerR family regulatory protein
MALRDPTVGSHNRRKPFLESRSMRHSGIAIGESSRRTACSIETIRYDEQIGLLPSPDR